MRSLRSVSSRLVVAVVSVVALLAALVAGVPVPAAAAHRPDVVRSSRPRQAALVDGSSPAGVPIGPINASGPALSLSDLAASVTMAMSDGAPITVTRALSGAMTPPAVATTTVGGVTQPDGGGSSPATQFQGPDWTSQLPGATPSARSEAALAYVSGLGATSDVLFGGYSSSSAVLGDTWTWNGLTWVNSSNSGPSARSGAVMAYDPSLGETVLFGGWNHASTVDSDTWAWNGTSWTQLSPSTSPGPLAYASMVWDSTSSEMVLFGGSTTGSGSTTNHTWTLTGSTNATAKWTELSPATSPPVRYRAAMAYDGSANDVVLFGGRSGSGTTLGDTWTFNGTTWTQQSPYASPVALSDASMAYDAQLGGDVLFGGANSGGTLLASSYYWNPSTGTWEVIENNTEPSARDDAVMATAAVNSATGSAGANGQLVLLGGTASSGAVGDTQIFDWGHNGSNTGDATNTLPVGDQSKVAVDLGTGNLYMTNDTYDIAGTGINSSNTAGYNSQGASSLNSIVATLGALPNGSILINELDGTYGTTIFTKSGSTFTAPPGTDATLTYCPSVSGPTCLTANTYVLTEHSSQTSYTFTSTGTMQLTTITDRNGDTISVTPTGSAPSTITDTRNRTVTNAYASSGGTQSETFTDNSLGRNWVESGPTGDANYTKLIDPTGAATNFTYNSVGQLTKLVDPDGNVRLFGYDANGRVDSVTQVTNVGAGTGPTTTYTWQAIPAGASPTPPAGAADEVVVTNPRGYSTTYVDGYGGLTLQVIDGNGHYRSSTYSADRQPMALTNALTNTTMLGYDSNNNPTQATAPKASSSSTTAQTAYSNYNTPSMTSGSNPLPILGYKYLPSSTLDVGGQCSALSYDAAGNPIEDYYGIIPSAGTTKCDGADSGGYARNFAYQGDPGVTGCGGKTGELCQTTDPTGSATMYSYDATGELTSVEQPVTGASCTAGALVDCTTYSYDAASRVKTVTVGTGAGSTVLVTTYSYDNDDRVTQVLYNGATSCVYSSGNCVTFNYSSAGNLQTKEDSSGTTSFGYDDLDRLTYETLPGNTNACASPPSGESGIIYSYDAANNLSGYCDKQGTVHYLYDPVNNLTGVGTDGGTCVSGPALQPCTSYGYDAGNEVTGITWPTSTGASEALTYYNNGEPKVVDASTSSTNFIDEYYSYTTSAGVDSDLLQWDENIPADNTTQYTYTSREALASATPTSGTTYTYTYGSRGNMIKAVGGSATTQLSQQATGALCWTLNATNSNSCGTIPSGATTYAYDHGGNETSSSAGESLTYNPIVQTAKTVAPGGSALTMAYTGTDSTQRTSIASTTQTTTLTNNAFGVASSATASSPTTYFTYNPGGRPGTLSSAYIAGSRYYYLYDALGNVVALINSAGSTSAATYTYTPFGTVSSSGTQAANNPFQYQGGYHDTDGWDKFGDRYYNPTTMLWTQPDPRAPSLENPASYLLYSFDSNDPINNDDTTGADATCLISQTCPTASPDGGSISLGDVFIALNVGYVLGACIVGFGAAGPYGCVVAGGLAYATPFPYEE